MSVMVRNTESVKSSCLIYVRKTEDITISVKYYNKIASNFEVGVLRRKHDAHLY